MGNKVQWVPVTIPKPIPPPFLAFQYLSTFISILIFLILFQWGGGWGGGAYADSDAPFCSSTEPETLLLQNQKQPQTLQAYTVENLL